MIYRYNDPKTKPNYHQLINYANVEIPISGMKSTKQFIKDEKDLVIRYPNLVKTENRIKLQIFNNPIPESVIRNKNSHAKKVRKLLKEYTQLYNNLLVSEGSDYIVYVLGYALYENSDLSNNRNFNDIGLRLVYETYINRITLSKSIILTNLDFHEYREAGYSL